MAVTQGQPQQVANIGLGIKQMKVDIKGTTVPVFLESMSHKVRFQSFVLYKKSSKLLSLFTHQS